MPAERSLNYLRGILDELLAIQQRLLSTPLTEDIAELQACIAELEYIQDNYTDTSNILY